MNVWGRGSQRVLKTLAPELRTVLHTVLQLRDISLIQGHRGEEEQNRYFKQQVSKVEWPNSKHNSWPSDAVDLQPSPYNAETLREDLSYIAGLMVGVGHQLGLDIRWGGDWDEDGETADNSFDDLFHFEIVRKPRAADNPAGVHSAGSTES